MNNTYSMSNFTPPHIADGKKVDKINISAQRFKRCSLRVSAACGIYKIKLSQT